MRAQTTPKKKGLSLWWTVFVHRYCHRALKLTMWLSFLLFNRHYQEVNSWPRLWVKLAAVWARNQDGTENPGGLASVDSKSPEFDHLTLKTAPSCPGLIFMLHSTIGLIAGSAEHSPPHQVKTSHSELLHFLERTFFNSENTFTNYNHMWHFFLIWWHLTI